MATKLDKNFGLGNSYKNVKLVKSGIKKSDSNTEKLVEELKYEEPIKVKLTDKLGDYIKSTHGRYCFIAKELEIEGLWLIDLTVSLEQGENSLTGYAYLLSKSAIYQFLYSDDAMSPDDILNTQFGVLLEGGSQANINISCANNLKVNNVDVPSLNDIKLYKINFGLPNDISVIITLNDGREFSSTPANLGVFFEYLGGRGALIYSVIIIDGNAENICSSLWSLGTTSLSYFDASGTLRHIPSTSTFTFFNQPQRI